MRCRACRRRVSISVRHGIATCGCCRRVSSVSSWEDDDAYDAFMSGRDHHGNPHYFDRDGNPLGLLEWGKLLEDREYKVVGQDRVKGWWVSTVWLGLDHRFGPGEPLIFETMTFDPWQDEQMQDRYSTLQDAKDGHELACAWVREQSTGITWRCVSLWKWITRTLVRRIRFMKFRSAIARWQAGAKQSMPARFRTLMKRAKKSIPVVSLTKDSRDSK